VRKSEEEDDMVHGTLEVLLVGAKGLENTDYLCTPRLNLADCPFSCYLFSLNVVVRGGGGQAFRLTIIAQQIFI